MFDDLVETGCERTGPPATRTSTAAIPSAICIDPRFTNDLWQHPDQRVEVVALEKKSVVTKRFPNIGRGKPLLLKARHACREYLALISGASSR